MFGEEEIKGITQIKIDEKGRIKLPKFTKAESGEEVALMFNIEQTKIVVMKLQEFEDKLACLAQRVEELYKERKIDYKTRLRYQRYIYGECCLEPPISVTSGERISIPKRAIRKLNLKDQVYCVGNETRLDIYPNEESYALSMSKKRNV